MTNKNLPQQILAKLEQVLPKEQRPLALHEPRFRGNEWNYVKETIDSGWVSSVGKFVDRIESDLAKFTESKFAIACVNGTAALHMCLKIAGVDTKDEVLLPTLTFVATANAIAYCGAIPHFVDSESKTLGVNAEKLDAYLAQISELRANECINRTTGRRIRALVVMHTFGHPVDLDAIAEICQKYRIVLVEDAAESLGTYYKGRHVGNHGLVSALSFNGNKIVTSGGGGAILTNDPQLAKLAKHITTTAKKSHAWKYEHDYIGFNYRMPNINAALGCAQLEELPAFLRSKRNLAEKYLSAFANFPGAKILREPEFAKSNYWLNALILDKPDFHLRDEILKCAHEAKILARPAWELLHSLDIYRDCPAMDCTEADRLRNSIINLPSSAFIDE